MSKEQKLIDIMFEMLMIQHEYPSKNRQELASWASKQLNQLGFQGKPIGLSWHILKSPKIDLGK